MNIFRVGLFLVLFMIVYTILNRKRLSQVSIQEGMEGGNCNKEVLVHETAGNLNVLKKKVDEIQKQTTSIPLLEEHVKELQKDMNKNNEKTKEAYDLAKDNQEALKSIANQAKEQAQNAQEKSDQISFE